MTLVVFTGAIGLLVAPGHLNPVLAFTADPVHRRRRGCLRRDQHVVRPRYRRDHAPHPQPADPCRADSTGRRVGFRRYAGGGLGAGHGTGGQSRRRPLVLALSIAFTCSSTPMWLKRRTPQNIVIGGAAGAFPPVIGWAAVTGSVDLIPLVLFAIVFIWTPPHFWSLALWANDDYRRAGVPMLPVVAGAKETRRQILLYTLVLVPLSLVPFFVGFSGPLYGVGAGLLGAVFLERVYRVMTDLQDETGVSLTRDMPAKRAFKYSVLYLFALFGVLALDRLVL